MEPKKVTANMRYVLAAIFLAISACAIDAQPDIGNFEPVFQDELRALPPSPPLDVTLRRGSYTRIGADVDATIEMGWLNTDQSLAEFPMRIRLPFAPVPGQYGSQGDVVLTQLDDVAPAFFWSDTGEPGPVPKALVVVLDQVSGAAMVMGAEERSPMGAPLLLGYSTGRLRVLMSPSYQTTGEHQYENQ